jgi:glycosyltransferase involved in cell wall biosynthesis
MPKVTAVLTTLNEERNIDRCLSSVQWADEIVVVDSFSTDKTIEQARKYTERVYQHEYPGSSRQVERAIQYATNEWILYVDADEEVSPELSQQIKGVLAHPSDIVGYEVLRKPSAFGKWIEHGGWFPDYQFRFFRKDSYQADHQEVHGGFNTRGRKGRLEGILFHHTYETIYSYVEKMNDYTSLQVSNKLHIHPTLVPKRRNLILSPLSHFLRMFFSKKGYKDGFHGFVLSLLDATYTLLLYAKIWEYQMHKAERDGKLPPITNHDLNKLKRIP